MTAPRMLPSSRNELEDLLEQPSVDDAKEDKGASFLAPLLDNSELCATLTCRGPD